LPPLASLDVLLLEGFLEGSGLGGRRRLDSILVVLTLSLLLFLLLLLSLLLLLLDDLDLTHCLIISHLVIVLIEAIGLIVLERARVLPVQGAASLSHVVSTHNVRILHVRLHFFVDLVVKVFMVASCLEVPASHRVLGSGEILPCGQLVPGHTGSPLPRLIPGFSLVSACHLTRGTELGVVGDHFQLLDVGDVEVAEPVFELQGVLFGLILLLPFLLPA